MSAGRVTAEPDGTRAASTPGRQARKPLTPAQVGIAAMVGNAIELYDFILYAFIAATVFGPLFFPTEVPWIGTLLALSGQALAFVVRPMGAVIFGNIGDKFGRRPALLASLALMGAATVAIGLLPTYAMIGAAAPIILVALRLLQGVAIGGEYPGAVIVAVEHAPKRLATFYGALPQMGNMLGILLAGLSLLVVNGIIGTELWTSWGWRLPFLFSGVLVVFGLILRTRLSETPEFIAANEKIRENQRESGKLGLLFRGHWRALAVTVLLWIGPVTFGYAFLTSLLAFVNTYRRHLTSTDVQLGLVMTASALVLIVACSGRYGDRIGREKIVLTSGILTVLWAVPSYILVDRQEPVALWTAMVVGAISYGIFGGVAPSLMSQQFPVNVRYIGVAASIALSALIGGALFPLPALTLVGANGGSSVPLMVMMAVSGLATTVGALILIRQRRRSATVSTVGV